MVNFVKLNTEKYQVLETDGVGEAIDELIHLGYIVQRTNVDFSWTIEKKHEETIRIWENDGNGKVENVLEDTGIVINSDKLVLATTGRSTIPQGTAQTLTLTSIDSHTNICSIANSVSDGAHLNWSKSQRCTKRYINDQKRG